MALDSFFIHNIDMNVTLASQAYYAGNGPLPVNPYQEGTEQWRAWRRARSAAAGAANDSALGRDDALSTQRYQYWE